MPRRSNTKKNQKLEQKQRARRARELAELEKTLELHDKTPTDLPVINEDKVRQSARIEQKRRHKRSAAGTPTKPTLVSTTCG